VGALIERTRALPLFLAAAMNVAIILLKSWRWREVMKAQAIDYPYPLAIRSYTIASALAAWTPGRLGDFSKAVSVARDRTISFGSAASSVIADRLLDALALTLVAAAGAGLLLGPVARTVTWCLLALAVVIGYVLLRWAGTHGAARTREALNNVGLTTASAEVGDALEGLERMTHRSGRRALASAIPATLGATFLVFLQGYLVAQSLGLPVGFMRLSAALGAASIASLLPLSVSGIGLREATLTVFLSASQIRLGEVLAFSFAFLIIVNGSVALLGALTHAAWPKPSAPLAVEPESGDCSV
jgi:uncharacterized protein (TIRG00374 family)